MRVKPSRQGQHCVERPKAKTVGREVQPVWLRGDKKGGPRQEAGPKSDWALWAAQRS